MKAATCFDRVRPEHRDRARATVDRVRDVFELTDAELAGRSRFEPVADGRRCASHVLKKHTPMSWAEIGSIFGRDRTAAISWASAMARRMVGNPDLVRLVERVEEVHNAQDDKEPS